MAVVNAQAHVVWCLTQLQDGRDEWAQIVASWEDAVALVNKCLDSESGREIKTYKVFKLGEEVPLRIREEEVPQPPVMMQRASRAK